MKKVEEMQKKNEDLEMIADEITKTLNDVYFVRSSIQTLAAPWTTRFWKRRLSSTSWHASFST